jgi:hypothetical protein
MRNLLKLIIVLLIFTSCRSRKSLLPDYSKNAYEPILLIKKQIEKTESEFNVEIENSHRGNYIVFSQISVLKDSIRINNEIHNNFYGTKSDTILNYLKSDFIEKLDYELRLVDRQVILAGNYQHIKISIKDSISEFYTRKGLGLMGILEDGQHMFKAAE